MSRVPSPASGRSSTRALHLGALKAKVANSRYYLSYAVTSSFAELYAHYGVTHELTISLGIHPKRFDPEVEFIPQMRRITRALTHDLRGVPKRQLETLRGRDAVWMAGFYEPTDAAGMLFPHWHGVIALREGEEGRARQILTERVGEDKTPGVEALEVGYRPVISTPRAKPTFHLQPLGTPENYIRYATKKVKDCNLTHWTVGDFLGQH